MGFRMVFCMAFERYWESVYDTTRRMFGTTSGYGQGFGSRSFDTTQASQFCLVLCMAFGALHCMVLEWYFIMGSGCVSWDFGVR